MLARSFLWLIATLAVVATLWLTLLSGGGNSPTAVPGGATTPSGTTSYSGAIDSAQSAVQQSNQDAKRAAR